MLSPQRKEPELNPEDNSRNSFTFPTPGDVLNSIEDLQRVVQELTLEEIRDAEERVSLMVRRLSSLQAVYTNFAAIRQFVINVQEARLHASEEDRGGPEKEIPQQYSRTPDKASENVISSSGNALLIKAEIDPPFENAAPGASTLVTTNQPAAPNPIGEADANPTTQSKEDLTAAQFDAFTLGENQLGEKGFELGFSITREAEEKIATLDEDHYAAIALTPEETSPAPFSFHQDPTSTELPTPPNSDRETVPPEFLDQMINNFSAFVGPMAAVIVDEQVANLGENLTAFPRLRLDELIGLVSREILDDHSKVRFQKQMAETIRTLKSQASPDSPRKKND